MENNKQNKSPQPGKRPNRPPIGPNPMRTWFILGVVLLGIVVLLSFMNTTNQNREFVEEPHYEKYLGEAEEVVLNKNKGRVEVVMPKPVSEDKKQKVYYYSMAAESMAEFDSGYLRRLKRDEPSTYKFSVRYVEKDTLIPALLQYGLPVLLMVGIVYFLFIRQAKAAGGSGMLSFGKSRARMWNKETSKVSFDDVAGIEEAKVEVQEIIQFLKNPKKFQRLGGRIPKGVLLVGPPGTGKTLLARAIAGEAEVPFFSICGSDFVEMFVGVGASRVRDLFRQAKENAPCIIFLDEVDAVGRRRGLNVTGGGHDEREQTLNAILVEMDGFETDEKVIVIAATNRADVLDPALLRPGRFDRSINLDLPDLKGREAILKVHSKKIKIAGAADLKSIARGTPGCSGADLEAIINEAAILATMREAKAVELQDLEEARDRVMFGRQKVSRVIDPEERRIIAFHETGHALLAKLLPHVEPLHKVTIIPRGRALGVTMQLPRRDRYILARRHAEARIMVALGGRIAEHMFFEDVSSGAAQDIKEATQMACMMVKEWGMSEKVGMIYYDENGSDYQRGEIIGSKPFSEASAVLIDEEVHNLIDTCYDRARKLLEEHREDLE
ncbi:MAG: ATP-dependent zinc metalloprotease FtsH, partial [Planctomycetota bacterium]